jgi:hypothetical protein
MCSACVTLQALLPDVLKDGTVDSFLVVSRVNPSVLTIYYHRRRINLKFLLNVYLLCCNKHRKILQQGAASSNCYIKLQSEPWEELLGQA